MNRYGCNCLCWCNNNNCGCKNKSHKCCKQENHSKCGCSTSNQECESWEYENTECGCLQNGYGYNQSGFGWY